MGDERKPRKATPAEEARILEMVRAARIDRGQRQVHLQAFSAVLVAGALAILGLVGGLFKPDGQTPGFAMYAYYGALCLLLGSVMVSLTVLRPRYQQASLKESTDNPFALHILEETLFFRRQRLLTWSYRFLCCGVLLGVAALIFQ